MKMHDESTTKLHTAGRRRRSSRKNKKIDHLYLFTIGWGGTYLGHRGTDTDIDKAFNRCEEGVRRISTGKRTITHSRNRSDTE